MLFTLKIVEGDTFILGELKISVPSREVTRRVFIRMVIWERVWGPRLERRRSRRICLLFDPRWYRRVVRREEEEEVGVRGGRRKGKEAIRGIIRRRKTSFGKSIGWLIWRWGGGGGGGKEIEGMKKSTIATRTAAAQKLSIYVR